MRAWRRRKSAGAEEAEGSGAGGDEGSGAEPGASEDGEGQPNRWRRWSRRIGIGAGGAVVALVLIVVTPLRGPVNDALSRVILFVATPWTPSTADFGRLPATSHLVASDGSALADVNPAEQRDLVRLQDLPPVVPHAVLAAEDAGFYHHHGISPFALLRAALRDVTGGKVQGGSTITQQLAKLNYTGGQHTLGRKFRELLYAERLEERYSKDQLLERYINQVYLGSSAYGIGAGARTFYGVPAQQLDAAQAATLAGKIRAPTTLDPTTHPDAVRVRRNEVLAAMESHHWITPAQRSAAEAEPVGPPPAPATASQGMAGHFVALAEREALTLPALGSTSDSRGYQLQNGGLTIRTTLDPKGLAAAVAATKTYLGQPGDPATAVVSVAPGDGAIRVLFGGLDPNASFDVASQGQRQPGSSFKPFTYMAMLAAGIDPRSQYSTESPITVPCPEGPYTVKNFEGETLPGPTTDVDSALAFSINTVFAQLVSRVGPTNVLTQAQAAGIHPGIRPGCAVGLGGLDHGVSPLEMAAAYATLATRGIYAAPYSIAEIDDSAGHAIYRHTPSTHQAFDPTMTGVLTSAMVRVVTQGTGQAASIGRPMAGKTGTTEHFGDAWFIGFVPQLATAVWVGHPEGSVPMDNVHGIAVAGGTYPARIFAAMMSQTLQGVPVMPLGTASPDQLHLHLDTTTTSSTTTTSTSAPPAGPATTGPPPPTTAPAPATTTPPTATTAPSAPQPPRSLAASPSPRKGGGIDLTWQAPAGGSAVDAYRVYRGTSPNQLTPLVDVTTTHYSDTSTVAGQTYYYVVTAVNSVGESQPSNQASAVAH